MTSCVSIKTRVNQETSSFENVLTKKSSARARKPMQSISVGINRQSDKETDLKTFKRVPTNKLL